MTDAIRGKPYIVRDPTVACSDQEKFAVPVNGKTDGNGLAAQTVFSLERTVHAPDIELDPALRVNARMQMDGSTFLAMLPEATIPVAFLDPQYRGILDKLAYGNEGKKRGRARSALPQMSEELIGHFISGIDRTLMPSGHLFLWMDKFHLCRGFNAWITETDLEVVDLVSWDKVRMGMGYRTRRTTEYCVVLQKHPRRAKGVWKTHNIPDTWQEQLPPKEHVHQKPVDLQGALLAAVSNKGDYVIDPAAGSFSVMTAALDRGRNFLGCDING